MVPTNVISEIKCGLFCGDTATYPRGFLTTYIVTAESCCDIMEEQMLQDYCTFEVYCVLSHNNNQYWRNHKTENRGKKPLKDVVRSDEATSERLVLARTKCPQVTEMM